MNKQMELLNLYLTSREERLNADEVLTVKLKDGMLTIYKELDPTSGEKKTITLVEEFDDSLDISVSDLISHQL